jgi:PTS system nitrogen regulatory IIA component
MKISEFLDADAVIPQLGAKDKPGILKELAGPLAKHIPVPAEKIFGMLSEREEIGTTGIVLFFALIAPENSAGLHLKALARISRLFKSPAFREAILKADGAAAIYALITREDDAH